MRTKPTYKGMTPPSTQNLKVLGLWVFFLICCSTFSFLPNVGLTLTLEYLTISSSSESYSSTTLIHSPRAEAISNPFTCTVVHILIRGHACFKSPSERLLIHGQTILVQAVNQRLGRTYKNENWANI